MGAPTSRSYCFFNSKKLLKKMEKWYLKHPPATSKGRCKSNLLSQASSSDVVNELLLSSYSDREGGASAGGVQ